MSYIKSFATHFPKYQIDNELFDPVFGKKKKGRKSIAFIDEDIISLSVAAAEKCLKNVTKNGIDGIILATTSPVFKGRSHASFIADLLGISSDIFCLDLTTSPRSGTDGLLLADQFISSKKYTNILLIATDCIFAEIGDELRNGQSHSACAMLLSSEKSEIEILNTASYESLFCEEFEYKQNKISMDSRFGTSVGILKNLKESINIFLKSNKKRVEDFDHIILNSMQAKHTIGVFLKAGFNAAKQMLIDNTAKIHGNTGVVHGLLQLCEWCNTKNGELLFIDYFGGSNLIHLKNQQKSAGTETLQEFRPIRSYQDYLKIRKSAFSEPKDQVEMFSSEMLQEREKEGLLRLTAHQCTSCNTIYYLKTNKCKKCKHNEFQTVQLAKTGTIFSFTNEFYFPGTFPPIGMAVIDLDGGGRITVQMTDDMYMDEKQSFTIGTKVRLILRRMIENDSKPNYFWKCIID